MPTQTLLPDALLAHAGWAGSPVIATIDEDPDTAGGDWLDPVTASGSGSSSPTARVSFPTPTGTPSGVQTFKARVGLTVSGGNAPTARIDLYESGALKASGSAQTISTTKASAGQVISQTFDLASTPLTTANGSGVEALVVVTASSGTTTSRRSASLDSVNWDTVTYSDPAPGGGGGELLSNPSFETDALGAAPAGWADKSVLAVATTFAVVDTWAAQGTKSLRFAGGQSVSGTGYPLVSPIAGGTDHLPATPGETYNANATVNVAVNSGQTVYLELEFFNVNPTKLASPGAVGTTALGVTTLSVSGVAPAGTAYVRYQLYQYPMSSGQTWDWRVDACSLATPTSGDTTPPVTTLGTPTRTTISAVAGWNTTDVTITAGEAFVEYMLRRVPAETSTRTEGTLIETATIAATTSLTVTITNGELAGVEGPNLVKAFTRDAAGNWSTN